MPPNIYAKSTTPPYSSSDGSCVKVGLPASTTRFADTDVSTGSAVSTGVNKSRRDSFAPQNAKRYWDVFRRERISIRQLLMVGHARECYHKDSARWLIRFNPDVTSKLRHQGVH